MSQLGLLPFTILFIHRGPQTFIRRKLKIKLKTKKLKKSNEKIKNEITKFIKL